MTGRSDKTPSLSAAPGSVDGVRVRPATGGDVEAMLTIYAPLVSDTVVSFEQTPPSAGEFGGRVERSLAWLVAERRGRILGYAYATPYRAREAYRWSVETSAYVHPRARRSGVATALYRTLLRQLADAGFCNAYAAIALPNEASVALHQRLWLAPIGVFARAGRKFDRWIDVGWWQRSLRERPPDSS